MNSALRWKLIAAFLLVFFAGVICGFFAFPHLWFGPHQLVRGDMATHMHARLSRDLHLSPPQREQIRPAVDRAAADLEATRRNTTDAVRRIFTTLHNEISPYLDAEQRGELQRLEDRHRAMVQHHHGGMPPPP